MQTFSTPMMQQYHRIKSEYADCLLFFRMGDFYELFLEDALIGSRVLNITLTKKAAGKDGPVPMAGVPYHAVDIYLGKLVKAGHKVAICEQMSEPNKYGLVDREVVRIVTPGTVVDEKSLPKKENNYIISLLCGTEVLGIAVADISTGQFQANEFAGDPYLIIRDELARIRPAECILPEQLYTNAQFLKLIKFQKNINISVFREWQTFSERATHFLKKQFGIQTLASFGLEHKPFAQQSAAALLGYLRYTQKDQVGHIKKITLYGRNEYVLLNPSTILNLELFSTIRDDSAQGTLVSTLDETITAMGGRLLKQWLVKPLIDEKEINARLDSVEEFLKQRIKRNILREHLKEIADIERLLSRLATGIGNARDMNHVKTSLIAVLRVREEIKEYQSSLTKKLHQSISAKLTQIIKYIDQTLVDDPPIELTQGGLIKPEVNPELDRLKNSISDNKAWLTRLEQTERQRTGINSLKVRSNKVFGFYIEVSNSNVSFVPKNYVRKQTLVNGERFITQELKEQELLVLTAEEKIHRLEYQLFQELLKKIESELTVIQQAAQVIATLDVLLNFAHIAEKSKYTRPKIVYSGEIKIKSGRHPVVEKLLEQMEFVPNDVLLNQTNQQLLIITGPNMAGKSVFIRQVALIVLMAQIGCFVPAQQAYISLVDRIFVRSGAADMITSGLSTFMVEMVETAQILHNATKNSLIIMDEIGRGTSTYDGISIAWAVAEYCVNKTHTKTLFATHYHELQALEKNFPDKIKNFQITVTQHEGEPIFLHSVTSGGASHSFGVAVAKLAGLPEMVIKRAEALLPQLESRDTVTTQKTMPISKSQPVIQELQKIDVNQLTPLEGLNLLQKLKEKYVKA